MLIGRTSPFTGKYNTMEIDVTQLQIDAWRSGVLIQEAMPRVCPAKREFIKTGITPEEWDNAFGEEE